MQFSGISLLLCTAVGGFYEDAFLLMPQQLRLPDLSVYNLCMCFNISMVQEREALEKEFSALFEQIDSFRRYEASGFTHPQWPIVPMDSPESAVSASWGLIPHWVKDKEQAAKLENMTLNARSETMWKLPSFRASAPAGRCLIPVDGFYEPHKYRGKSYPFYLYRNDRRPFALAGLYADWRHPGTHEIVRSFSIVTRQAEGLLQKIHNHKERMPVVLPHAWYGAWLDSELSREAVDEVFGSPAAMAVGQLTAHAVSPLLYSRNSARNRADVQQLHRYGIPEIDDLVTDLSSAGYAGNPGFSAGADPHYSSESSKGHETSEKSESTENSETSGKSGTSGTSGKSGTSGTSGTSDGQLSLF